MFEEEQHGFIKAYPKDGGRRIPFASFVLCVIFLLVITGSALAGPFIPVQREADIWSGANSSYPNYLSVYNGKLYFAATGNNGAGAELWSFDGTTASLAADINNGSNGSYPQKPTAYNGKLYFGADGGGGLGYELWSFNGTTASLVADIWSGPFYSNPNNFAVYNDKLYFSANGGDDKGYELWSYNGSTTSRVADICTGEDSSYPRSLAVFNSKLYFQANGCDGAGAELWSFDGTTTTRIADIYDGATGSFPMFLTVYNGKLYFRAINAGVGFQLFSYDLTSVQQITAPPFEYPSHLAVYNGKLFFETDGGDGAGYELWSYDGSNTSRAADIQSGSGSSEPNYLTVYNNKLFFSADGGDGAGYELWSYGGSSTPPTVTVTSPANNATITPTNTLKVTFNVDMTHDGDTGAANFPPNYLLVEAKGNGFTTISCLSTDFVGDTPIKINSATYDNHNGDGPFETTLIVNNGDPLPNGSYRLFICGTTSVTDLAGNKINNGADSVVSFTVASLAALPQTGFAPGVITQVGSQPLDKAYQDMGGLKLEIPSLGIHASIVGVPRTSQGWDLSWLGNQAGWLEGTSFPTWAGNSALTAHVVDSNGQPGLFANLGKLSYGKEIVIQAWGQRYVYQVRSVKTAVNPEDVSAFKHRDYPYLTLITCKGYDEKNNTYRWRVVVQAVQVRVE